MNKDYIERHLPAVFALLAACCFGNALWWFDAWVIDGAVNGAARLAGRVRLARCGGLRRGGSRTTASALRPVLVIVLVVYAVAR